jgi:hypothetical protein
METLPLEVQESAEAAIRRRAEGYLPPVHERVWLTQNAEEILDPAVLALLDAPHSELQGDTTIRPWLWAHVDDFVPRTAWATTCDSARNQALRVITERHDLIERCAHAAALLRTEGEDSAARIRARREVDAAERANAELELVAALAEGVASPRVDVDAAGLVILSSEPIPRDELR